MAKGIIYVMTTVVDGLVKIGQTAGNNFEQRMYNLERHGYCNITGLKRYFAIEVSDYEDKEKLLHSLFSRSRVSNTELFSLNVNEVVQLLSSFDGKIIFPREESRTVIFTNATEAMQSAVIPDGTYSLDIKPQNVNYRVQATMIVENGTLTVQKGAVLGKVTRISVASWNQLRTSLKTSGNVTTEDFKATSPSMAAAIILGHNTNGWTAWKNADNEYIDVYRTANGANENE